MECNMLYIDGTPLSRSVRFSSLSSPCSTSLTPLPRLMWTLLSCSASGRRGRRGIRSTLRLYRNRWSSQDRKPRKTTSRYPSISYILKPQDMFVCSGLIEELVRPTDLKLGRGGGGILYLVLISKKIFTPSLP